MRKTLHIFFSTIFRAFACRALMLDAFCWSFIRIGPFESAFFLARQAPIVKSSHETDISKFPTRKMSPQTDITPAVWRGLTSPSFLFSPCTIFRPQTNAHISRKANTFDPKSCIQSVRSINISLVMQVAVMAANKMYIANGYLCNTPLTLTQWHRRAHICEQRRWIGWCDMILWICGNLSMRLSFWSAQTFRNGEASSRNIQSIHRHLVHLYLSRAECPRSHTDTPKEAFISPPAWLLFNVLSPEDIRALAGAAIAESVSQPENPNRQLWQIHALVVTGTHVWRCFSEPNPFTYEYNPSLWKTSHLWSFLFYGSISSSRV